MAYYKIKNLTNLLPKRHIHNNTIIDVEYLHGFEKKIHKLKVGNETYISCGNLPISIHKLRMKKLISVQEVSHNDFFKAQNPSNIGVKKEKNIITTSTTTVPKKKKNYRKKSSGSTKHNTIISTPEE